MFRVRWLYGSLGAIAPLPTACGSVACVVVGGMLHGIGGAIGDTSATKKSVDWHLVYDPKTDRWERRAPMPTGRDHVGALAVGNLIHVIGGRVDSFHTNSNLHHIYDPARDVWEARNPLPTARSGHGAVYYRGKIFVMGGEGTNRVYGQNEAYDPENRCVGALCSHADAAPWAWGRGDRRGHLRGGRRAGHGRRRAERRARSVHPRLTPKPLCQRVPRRRDVLAAYDQERTHMKNRDIPLIPRQALFGNPDRASVQVSPDGMHLSWLAPLDGVLNVWVAPRGDLAAARPVTRDTGRGIRSYLWAYTGIHLLYIQDKNGDENWRLYVVDLQSDAVQDLTPFEGVQTRLIEVSHKYPNAVIVGLNQRHPQWHDLYRVDLVTGERTIFLEHDRFSEVGVDDDYHLRYASQMTLDGGVDIYVPAGDAWQLWDSIPAEDTLTTSPLGFDKTNQRMYMQDSRGRDTSALIELNLETQEKRLLAEDPQADVANVVQHPTERHVQAVSFIYDRKRWQVLDPSIEPDLIYLGTVADGDVEIISRTLDDGYWVVLYLVDDGPARFYLYDRKQREARFLFTNRQALEGLALVHMHPVVISRSRRPEPGSLLLSAARCRCER